MPRPSRTHEAVDQLLDAIIEGRLTAGEQLPPEGQLAAEFGVSRLTLREAVRLLQAQGVIVQVPGSRHRIAPVSEWTGMDAVVRYANTSGLRRKASIQLLEVRRMIETGAAQLAAERRTEEHLAALSDALERMIEHHDSGDIDAFIVADLQFHDAIIRAANNRILTATLLPLTSVLADTRVDTSAIAEIREHAIDGHREVLEAVRAGAAVEARDAMERHMSQTHADLLELVPE